MKKVLGPYKIQLHNVVTIPEEVCNKLKHPDLIIWVIGKEVQIKKCVLKLNQK